MGGISCGTKFCKYIVFLFNLIIFLVGLLIMVAGIVVRVRFARYLEFFSGSLHAVAIIIIILGLVVAAVGFLGCFGAVRENPCMLYTYAVCLLIFLLLEIAMGIIAFVFHGKLDKDLVTALTAAQRNYQIHGHAGVTFTWDLVQKDFKCCGVDNYTDWMRFSPGLMTNASVPDACCRKDKPKCGVDKAKLPLFKAHPIIYTEGCFIKLMAWAKDHVGLLGGVGCGLAVIEIGGIVIACLLARTLGESSSDEDEDEPKE